MPSSSISNCIFHQKAWFYHSGYKSKSSQWDLEEVEFWEQKVLKWVGRCWWIQGYCKQGGLTWSTWNVISIELHWRGSFGIPEKVWFRADTTRQRKKQLLWYEVDLWNIRMESKRQLFFSLCYWIKTRSILK